MGGNILYGTTHVEIEAWLLNFAQLPETKILIKTFSRKRFA
jgi:hypothetical protein